VLRGAAPRAPGSPSPVLFETKAEVVRVDDSDAEATGWPLAVTLSSGRCLRPSLAAPTPRNASLCEVAASLQARARAVRACRGEWCGHEESGGGGAPRSRRICPPFAALNVGVYPGCMASTSWSRRLEWSTPRASTATLRALVIKSRMPASPAPCLGVLSRSAARQASRQAYSSSRQGPAP